MSIIKNSQKKKRSTHKMRLHFAGKPMIGLTARCRDQDIWRQAHAENEGSAARNRDYASDPASSWEHSHSQPSHLPHSVFLLCRYQQHLSDQVQDPD